LQVTLDEGLSQPVSGIRRPSSEALGQANECHTKKQNMWVMEDHQFDPADLSRHGLGRRFPKTTGPPRDSQAPSRGGFGL